MNTDMWHGTAGGYSNHRCRCDACRGAWAKLALEGRRRRANKKIPAHVHGTENGYTNYACRCRLCKDAHAAWARTSKRSAGRD